MNLSSPFRRAWVFLLGCALILGACTSQPTLTERIELTAAQPPSAPLEVHFVSVTEGDAILVCTPERQVIVIDGGEADGLLLAYLRAQGVQRIDLMIATHGHRDHIGGLTGVLKALPVDRVVVNGQQIDQRDELARGYAEFVSAVAASGAEYWQVKRPAEIQVGSVHLSVLNPERLRGADAINDNSIVLRLSYGKVAFLLSGDVEEAAVGDMLAAGVNLQADVLKLAHHGSRIANGAAFVDRVQPRLAVYTTNQEKSLGPYQSEMLALLQERGIQYFSTGTNGHIVMTSDGETIAVQTERATATTPAIRVLELTSPVLAGEMATLQIQTEPGAKCSVAVYEEFERSEHPDLATQKADANGLVTWKWRVYKDTPPGNWLIRVKAKTENDAASIETTYRVLAH